MSIRNKYQSWRESRKTPVRGRETATRNGDSTRIPAARVGEIARNFREMQVVNAGRHPDRQRPARKPAARERQGRSR